MELEQQQQHQQCEGGRRERSESSPGFFCFVLEKRCEEEDRGANDKLYWDLSLDWNKMKMKILLYNSFARYLERFGSWVLEVFALTEERRTSEWATRPMELEIKRNSQTHPLWLLGEIPSLLLLFISRHSQQHNTHRKKMRKEDAEHKRREKMLPRKIYDQIKFLTKIIALLYHDTPVLPVRIRKRWCWRMDEMAAANNLEMKIFSEIVIVLI